MWAICKKEIKTMFCSPLGYIVIGIFLLVYSIIFHITAIENGVVDLSYTYYGVATYGLPIIIALLTMKSFSEEKNKGTDQLLFLSPKSTFLIVMGKFLAAFIIIFITILFSFMYYFILKSFGNPNIKMVLVSMLGFLLLSMACISAGILFSSFTENQIIAALITITFLFLPIFLPNIEGEWQKIIVLGYYTKFPLGVISFSEIVGLISFTVMCICLTVVSIRRKKF